MSEVFRISPEDQATETTLASIKNDGIKKITDPVNTNTDALYATEYGATYNYIMKYKRGTTEWEIQRETISTGVRDYASGDSALATVWTNRATQTYGDL